MFEEQELKNLLALSRLSVPPERLGELSKQLEEILGYFERLSRIDTSSVDVDLGATEPAGDRRADEEAPGLARETIPSFSQTFEDGFFVVPRILGDEHG